jgi:FkbM family methyltransferase
MRHERLHRFIRALWTHYPMKFGAAWLNRRLDRFFDSPEPNWLLAPGRGKWPTMVLNVSINLQRKLFYFPKVYGRFYGGNEFARYLAQELPAGGGFLDIGANVGFFSLQAARLVGPSGHVWAFEPEPDIHEALVRSARANELPQLEAFQLALSDRDGELPFYRARDGTASSLVPEAPGREARYERTLVTPVTTLDKVAAAGKIDPKAITMIKVDVEGEEVRTVRGMLDTLAAAGRPPLWCEVRGPKGSTRAPDTFLGVRDELARLGYVPLRWHDGARAHVGDVVERTDVLFEPG